MPRTRSISALTSASRAGDCPFSSGMPLWVPIVGISSLSINVLYERPSAELRARPPSLQQPSARPALPTTPAASGTRPPSRQRAPNGPPRSRPVSAGDRSSTDQPGSPPGPSPWPLRVWDGPASVAGVRGLKPVSLPLMSGPDPAATQTPSLLYRMSRRVFWNFTAARKKSPHATRGGYSAS
jgi:hypothetical protein